MPKSTAKTNTIPPKEKIIKKTRFFLQKFTLHANLKDNKAGSVIRLKCFKDTKKPCDPYWRRRLHEAQADRCMTIYKEPKPDKKVVNE